MMQTTAVLTALLFILDIAEAHGGVVIRKPKEVTESMQAADAINDYRKAEEAKAETIKFAAASPKGARVKNMRDVLHAMGKSVESAEAAKAETEEMMNDVAIEGDLPTKEPPKVDKDLDKQADELADRMGSGALGCGCAAQLYGDASTTEDTRVSLMGKKGQVSHSYKNHAHHKHKAAHHEANTQRQRLRTTGKHPYVSTYDLDDDDCDCDDE